MEQTLTVKDFAGTWKLLLKLPPIIREGVEISKGYSHSLPRYQKQDIAAITPGTYLLVLTTLDGQSHIQGEFTLKKFNKLNLGMIVNAYFSGMLTITDNTEPVMWGVDEYINVPTLRGWLQCVEFVGVSNEIYLTPGKYRLVLISGNGMKHTQKDFIVDRGNVITLESYKAAFQPEGFSM